MTEWPIGVGREVFKTLDSTNAEAIRSANAGERGPTWIFSEEQTQGRARRGRTWVQGSGQFSATLLMRPEGGPDQAALRSFIAALALREALVEVTDHNQFSLKWPNDVLLNDKKLAGILLESGQGYLCVGIGVNLSITPDIPVAEQGAMQPISLGTTIAPLDFLTPLAAAFQRWETQFIQFGFTPIRQEWLNHATRLGQQITAKMVNRTEIGIFETVDETGAIVLKTQKGVLHLPAAEIFFETEA